MSTHYARSVPCPAAEFGLPPCGKRLIQHAVQHPNGFMQPGDWIEEEEIIPSCDCENQVTDWTYWTRVWELLEAQDWKLDDNDPYEGDY